MIHELVDVHVEDGAAAGRCTCGRTYGPHRDGESTIRHPTDSLDRVFLSWAGVEMVEVDHRCHAEWESTATALAKAAAA